jgi:hypothetical protein
MTGVLPDPAALDRLSTWEELCSASGIDHMELRRALLGGLFGGENGVEQRAVKEAEMNAPEPVLLGLVGLDGFKDLVN